MIGLTLNSTTNTNQLQINIPDELKGIELQIIILPVVKEISQEIEFFTECELQQLPALQPGTHPDDNEDYSTW